MKEHVKSFARRWLLKTAQAGYRTADRIDRTCYRIQKWMDKR